MSKEMNYKELYRSFVDYESVFMQDVPFYGQFLKILKDSTNTFSLTNKRFDKILDSEWLDAIEKRLPSLDKCIRNPRKFIENREEVLPIEVSRNINAESIKHLCQHTDYISKVEGDKVTPSKILNVFKEESLNTYENRFVYTLLNRLFVFLTKRTDALAGMSDEENYTMLKMDQQINVNKKEKLEISLSIKSSVEKGNIEISDDSDSLESRLKKLNKIVSGYMGSSFASEIKQFGFIRPPVMRTNAILKDTDLRNCLDLWIFIESYDKVGYSINSVDTVQSPSERYVEQLYELSAISYALFLQHTEGEVTEDNVLRRVRRKNAIVPRFLKEIYEEFTKEYDITEVEFRRVMDTRLIEFKKAKSNDEQKIKRAIINALKHEKQKEKAAEKEKLKKEKQKTANDKKKVSSKPKKTVSKAEKTRKTKSNTEPDSQK